jgi:hypothetical protein
LRFIEPYVVIRFFLFWLFPKWTHSETPRVIYVFFLVLTDVFILSRMFLLLLTVLFGTSFAQLWKITSTKKSGGIRCIGNTISHPDGIQTQEAVLVTSCNASCSCATTSNNVCTWSVCTTTLPNPIGSQASWIEAIGYETFADAACTGASTGFSVWDKDWCSEVGPESQTEKATCNSQGQVVVKKFLRSGPCSDSHDHNTTIYPTTCTNGFRAIGCSSGHMTAASSVLLFGFLSLLLIIL